MSKSKTIHADLKEGLATRFDMIKESLGMQNDAEVIRFLIQKFFQDNLAPSEIAAREAVEGDTRLIKKFMDRYEQEWRKLGEDP